jgi:hypothetical protein
MARVLTIYNSGTWYDEANDDLIARMAKLTGGTRGKDWELNPGPGSKGQIRRDGPGVSTRIPVGGPVGMVVRHAVGDEISKIEGGALGTGTEATAEAIVRLATTLKPEVVNMVGWSRGAVAAVVAANYMAQRNITAGVNLFLIDPVIGAGNRHLHWKPLDTIGNNVRKAVVIQQMHDDNWMMPPHMLSSAGDRSRLLLLPMPGKHSSAVEKSTDGTYDEAYTLTERLCHAFLTERGTMLRALVGSNEPCITLYSRLWAKTLGKAIATDRRTAVRPLSRSVFNAHHMDVLSEVIPKNATALRQLLSQHSPYLPPDMKNAALTEINLVKQRLAADTDTQTYLEHLRWAVLLAEQMTPGAQIKDMLKVQQTPSGPVLRAPLPGH